MERMTVKRADGRWALANNDGASPAKQLEKFPVAMERLAAYEDTGLSPEEIEAFVAQVRRDMLTLPDLLAMKGRPVYLSGKGLNQYDIFNEVSTDGIACFWKAALPVEDFGKTWMAYRRRMGD